MVRAWFFGREIKRAFWKWTFVVVFSLVSLILSVPCLILESFLRFLSGVIHAIVGTRGEIKEEIRRDVEFCNLIGYKPPGWIRKMQEAVLADEPAETDNAEKESQKNPYIGFRVLDRP